ncbi:Endonuclease/exonuclease/phosphatase, partial [Dimargaris cristalligena]
MSPLRIALWNARSLSTAKAQDALRHASLFDIIFITETWLLPPKRLHTPWTQYHQYGLPTSNQRLGHMGICALINPLLNIPIINLNLTSPHCLGLSLGSFQIICLYIPPLLPSETLISTLSSLPLTPNTILCGDFNSRHRQLTGDHRQNTLGIALLEWITTTPFQVLNNTLAHGIPTLYRYFPGRPTQTSIIDLFICNFEVESASLNIHKDLTLGSDHAVLILTFSPPPLPTPLPPTSTPYKWRLNRLADEKHRLQYTTSFTTNSTPLLNQLLPLITNPPPLAPDIHQLTLALNSCIYTALDSSVGRQGPHTPFSKPWWTPHLTSAVQLRDRLYKQWHQAIGINKIVKWAAYQLAQRKFRNAIHSHQRRSW